MVFTSCLGNMMSYNLFVWRVYCAGVFSTSPDILRKNVDYDGFSTIFANILVENCYLHIKHGYTLRNLLETLPS